MARSRILAVLLLGILLSACAGRGAAITCLTVRAYSPAFQAAAARELDSIRASAPNVAILVDDYGVDRDATRKCIEKRDAHRGGTKKKFFGLLP